MALQVVGRWLLSANRQSGSISIIDPTSGEVVREQKIAGQLSDLTMAGASDLCLATDEASHDLIVIELTEIEGEAAVVVRDRQAIGHTPVSAHSAGNVCSVASLWSRRVALLKLVDAQFKPMATIDLPFAPRLQWSDASGRWLVVADAFGGQLGVIDLRAGRLRSVHSFEGHNIRGLATSADGSQLLIAHQRLSPFTETTRSRIFWGNLMGNSIIAVSLDDLIPNEPVVGESVAGEPMVNKRITRWSMFPLGQPGLGAADPGEVLVTRSGQRVVCLSGVDQVGFLQPSPNAMQRIPVGRRPMALATDRAQKTLFVANTLDDTISVIDVATARVRQTIALGPQPELGLAERGERLFSDARLSLDGWLSCQSCHTDGHTNGQLNDNLGDGGFGAPKRVLSLLGTAETTPWAWRGSQELLSAQVHKSIATTMQGEETGRLTKENVEALTAFLATLDPPPSLAEARGNFDQVAFRRGRDVFYEYSCSNCHFPPIYSSTAVFDVDIHDESGETEFNPPSLLGVSQRGPYFHDGRAKQLRDVFEEYEHPRGLSLSAKELNDLLAFLNAL